MFRKKEELKVDDTPASFRNAVRGVLSEYAESTVNKMSPKPLTQQRVALANEYIRILDGQPITTRTQSLEILEKLIAKNEALTNASNVKLEKTFGRKTENVSGGIVHDEQLGDRYVEAYPIDQGPRVQVEKGGLNASLYALKGRFESLLRSNPEVSPPKEAPTPRRGSGST